MAKNRPSRPVSARPLFIESLENRRMMAGDIHHNFLLPEDVDSSGAITPLDALIAINRLNRADTAATAEPTAPASRSMVDVNADEMVSPIDALIVINRLSSQIYVGGNTTRVSLVDTQQRMERIERAIAANELPPGIEYDDAQQILQTLRLGGRPELGDYVENGSLRWNPAESSASVDPREEPVSNDRSQVEQFAAAVSQRLVAFNVPTETIATIGSEITGAYESGTLMDYGQVRERLTELGVDVNTIFPQPSAASPPVSLETRPEPRNAIADPPVPADDSDRVDTPPDREPPTVAMVMVTAPVATSLLARLAEAGVSEDIIGTIAEEIWSAIDAERPLSMLQVRLRLGELGG